MVDSKENCKFDLGVEGLNWFVSESCFYEHGNMNNKDKLKYQSDSKCSLAVQICLLG